MDKEDNTLSSTSTKRLVFLRKVNLLLLFNFVANEILEESLKSTQQLDLYLYFNYRLTYASEAFRNICER